MVALRSSSNASSESATAIAPAEPAGAANADWLIAIVVANNAVTISDNNGSTAFTKNHQGQESSSGSTMAVFVRKRQAGDPATLSFNHDGSADRISAVVMAFSGGDASTAYDVAPSATTEDIIDVGSGTHTCNDITTIAADAIHIVCDMLDSAATTFSTFPAGYSAVAVSENGQHIAVYYLAVATPSATGVQTFTNGGTVSGITQSFAIKDASAGVPVITVVDTDNAWTDGDTGLAITGTGFV